MARMNDVTRARTFFPRGLTQPPLSFRFSVDALLLAAFAHRAPREDEPAGPRRQRLLDLGCGCGVVAFGVLLQQPKTLAVGVDVQDLLVAAALDNAHKLGLQQRFAALRLDLADPASLAVHETIGDPAVDKDPPVSTGKTHNKHTPTLPRAAFDLVTANPPFRRADRGRLPPGEARRLALFADASTLPAFVRAAKHALAPGGRCALIYPAESCGELVETLKDHGLAPVRLRMVSARPRQTPMRCLVLAGHREELPQPPCCDPPLILCCGGNSKEYTTEARAFCPWLTPRSPAAPVSPPVPESSFP